MARICTHLLSLSVLLPIGLLATSDTITGAGGILSIDDATSAAYSHPAPSLDAELLERHLQGDLDFEATFVSSPAPVNAGLGPLYNNTNCINCHVRDGRGRPDRLGTSRSSLLLKLSIPGRDAQTGAPIAVPLFGEQLQDKSLFSQRPEGQVHIEYTEVAFTYPDGSTASLRKPNYSIQNPAYPLPENLQISPRIAPAVFGRGLLEAVPDKTLIALSDPEDRDHDGIRGRVNRVWNPLTQQTEIGRFGLKANHASLLLQNAAAYAEDMGISSPIHPNTHPEAIEHEISEEVLQRVTLYVQTLAVPNRRNREDSEVQQGERLFEQLKCAVCHVPTLKTGEFPQLPLLANQTFHPYTDLLLHDMGEGLADGREDFEASGQDWRTPPLWGIGLTRTVSGHQFFLHDGRARSLEEAILWHGGEASDSQKAFTQLNSNERAALLKFLSSL